MGGQIGKNVILRLLIVIGVLVLMINLVKYIV
jgi:hypothetical protein